MEELFAFLPALFILIIVGSRLYEVFRKLSGDQEQQAGKYTKPPRANVPYEDMDFEELEDDVSEGNLVDNTVEGYENMQLENESFFEKQPDTVLEKTEEDMRLEVDTENGDNRESQTEEKSKASRKKSRSKKARDKKKQSRYENKTNIFEKKLTQDDLVKGIIMKEILDKPRAKRPHKLR